MSPNATPNSAPCNAPRAPRETFLPYGRQCIDEEDIAAVVEVLRSDWLTTGPAVADFEQAVADYVHSRFAVVVSSGTAALHAAMHAIDLAAGDEVIVPPMTFAATANAVAYVGGRPVFADVLPGTLLIDPADVQRKITERTRAIIAVDYAGQPCDYDALRALADRHNLRLIADGCHALGASYKNRPVGSMADMTVFSFHPVKHVTTGEGGMVTTGDKTLADRLRRFRNHGISTDHHQRASRSSWHYEMIELGYNYRITDIQCALGRQQLKKLPGWITRRQEIARTYDQALAALPGIEPLAVDEGASHAYHLYVVRIDDQVLNGGRDRFFQRMREQNIGVNVHYIPVHLHPWYRQTYNTGPGHCPVAEQAYEQIISLPIFPAMSDADVQDVLSATEGAFEDAK